MLRKLASLSPFHCQGDFICLMPHSLLPYDPPSYDIFGLVQMTWVECLLVFSFCPQDTTGQMLLSGNDLLLALTRKQLSRNYSVNFRTNNFFWTIRCGYLQIFGPTVLTEQICLESWLEKSTWGVTSSGPSAERNCPKSS